MPPEFAAAGMDLSRLDQAFEFEKETSQHGGLVVVRHGYLVYGKYFGKANREAHPDMASIGEAFTSVACGIMLKEKHDLIPDGLETKIFTEKYLPQAFLLDDPAKAEIKLGQLLSMSAGLHGEGSNPGIVNGIDQKLDPPADVNGAPGERQAGCTGFESECHLPRLPAHTSWQNIQCDEAGLWL